MNLLINKRSDDKCEYNIFLCGDFLSKSNKLVYDRADINDDFKFKSFREAMGVVKNHYKVIKEIPCPLSNRRRFCRHFKCEPKHA